MKTLIRIGLLAVTSSLAACGSGGGNAVAQIAASEAGQPWPSFYQKANEEFAAGRRDEAVTLFYVGQLRGRIIVQCTNPRPDGDPALLASLNETVGRTMNEYAGGDPAGWAAAIDRALAFDAANPDPNAPSGECRAERERQRTGLAQLRTHILSNVDEIRAQRTANGLPNR